MNALLHECSITKLMCTFKKIQISLNQLSDNLSLIVDMVLIFHPICSFIQKYIQNAIRTFVDLKACFMMSIHFCIKVHISLGIFKKRVNESLHIPSIKLANDNSNVNLMPHRITLCCVGALRGYNSDLPLTYIQMCQRGPS